MHNKQETLCSTPTEYKINKKYISQEQQLPARHPEQSVDLAQGVFSNWTTINEPTGNMIHITKIFPFSFGQQC